MRCRFRWQSCKLLSGYVHSLQSASCCVLIHFYMSHLLLLLSLAKLYIPYFLQIGGLCLYKYMCSNVLFCEMYSCLHLCKCVICMCMYVCRCVLFKLIVVLQSAVVLLLFSCCHRNTVVAKPLLLPSYLMSCSLFPQWLRTRPRPSSLNTSSPYRLLAALQQPGYEVY